MSEPVIGILVTCTNCQGTGFAYDPNYEMVTTCAFCKGTGRVLIQSSNN